MKLRNFLVAFALLSMASLSFGQMQFGVGFLGLGSNAYNGATPAQGLTNHCTTDLANEPQGDPVPPGTMVTLYWALTNQPYPANGTGAGFTGEGYPYSIENSWVIDGETWPGGGAGCFYVAGLNCGSGTPASPTFYLVVETANVRWQSQNYTPQGTNPYPDFIPELWECQTLVLPCNEDPNINIHVQNWHTFAPYYQCIHLCGPDQGLPRPRTICMGPLKADNVPHVTLIPGCRMDPICWAPECPIITATYVVPWHFVPDPFGGMWGMWCATIASEAEGCVCLSVDFIEAAELSNFDAIAGDNSVVLNWSTSSSSDLSSYTITRDGEFLTSVVAENSPTSVSYTYTDNTAINGTTYIYSLSAVDMDGNVQDMGRTVTATPSMNAAVITEYALHQNYPNPFNPTTNIVFDVVSDNFVTLKVYNAMGQEVSTLVNGTQSAGRHTVAFDAANMTSGLYFYTVKIGNEFTATKKMMLVK